MSMVFAASALLIWLGLLVMGFWTCRERDSRAPFIEPVHWPDVVAVVPARNEADVIAEALASLVAQDYPGSFRIILVDDNSEDGTGDVARATGVEVLSGHPLAPGWTGKLWALHQGIAAAGEPKYLWLTDADIAHAPDTLRRLVGIAHGGERKLVSFMAQLHCQTWAERALIPAFVYFFMMLYPFNWINRRRGGRAGSKIAGAAGGCVLVEHAALAAAGGIAAMRGALIDDCTLGKLIKQQGRIWLGLTHRSRSIRPYLGAGEVATMIARSAYAQLRYNPLMLLGTLVGMGFIFGLAPWLAIAGDNAARWLALATCGLMALSYQPLLHFYRRSPLWGLVLPLVAGFYCWCVLLSAWQFYRGQGGMWKGRAQAIMP